MMKPTKQCVLHSITSEGKGRLRAFVTILDDPTGKFFPQQFVSTSLVVKVDVQKHVVETLNTFYHYL